MNPYSTKDTNDPNDIDKLRLYILNSSFGSAGAQGQAPTNAAGETRPSDEHIFARARTRYAQRFGPLIPGSAALFETPSPSYVWFLTGVAARSSV